MFPGAFPKVQKPGCLFYRCFQGRKDLFLHFFSVTLKQLQILNTGKFLGIFRDLHGIPVTFLQDDFSQIFSQDFGQKRQYILRFLIQRLRPVSKNGHAAGKQGLQDFILKIRIILHLVDDQMFDVLMVCFSEKPVLQIQHRKDIFISQHTLFQRNRRQLRISAFLHHPLIDFVNIPGHVHFLKLCLYCLPILVRQIPVMERFPRVNKILHDHLHTRQKRRFLKLEVEHLDQLLLRQFHSAEFYRSEIHQPVFQLRQEAFGLTDETGGLFPLISFSCLWIPRCHLLLQPVTAVFTIRHNSPQFPVRKQVETHLLDIFLSQFRKDMGDIIGKHTIGRQDQYIGRFQMFPVMIEQIGNPVQGDGSLSASRRSLDHQDPVPGIPDDRVLFLLYRADNVFQPHISIASQLPFQDLIINFYIALKTIDHLSAADLILPLGQNLPVHLPCRRLIRSRSFVIIVKQSADRRAPVIDHRNHTRFFRKIPDADIKSLRVLLSVIEEIHPAEKRRIQHSLQTVFHTEILLIGIDLMEQCLLIVEIFIAVLVHFRVVFPVILMHALDVFLPLGNLPVQFVHTVFQFFFHLFQVFCSIYLCCHFTPTIYSYEHFFSLPAINAQNFRSCSPLPGYAFPVR